MVNINTVYQTVLYILNKEQRGYIPPDEFNSIANQVQFEIFQSYFPDGNQLNRQNQNNTQNDTEFFNMFKNNSGKLTPFEAEVLYEYSDTDLFWVPAAGATSGSNAYLYGDIMATYSSSLTGTTSPQGSTAGGEFVAQLTSVKDYNKIIRSRLTAPTYQNPLALSISSQGVSSDTFFRIYPLPTSLRVNCILTPAEARWSFTVGSLGQYLFNQTASQDFLLDISEQSNIIIGILKYAGVVINDPTIIDVAGQEAAQVQANEKS